MWEACTLESAKDATIASEEFSLYATHEIVYRVPSTYSINWIDIIKEVSHASAAVTYLPHGVHKAGTQKTIEEGIFGELFESLLPSWRR